MVIQEETPLKQEVKEKKKKKSLREKYQELKENVTVEPALACYVVPGALSRLATQNLNLDKACRVNMNYGDKICNALINRDGSYQDQEIAIQELIAGMEAWKNVLLTAIPSLLILFIGAWSDRTRKRKICILLPIFGDFLMCLSNIVNVYYFNELPVQITMFFEALFPAITGGWITTYMGVFSYISDVSSEESRTFRIGMANLCLTAGGPIGSALSGILLKHIGYYGVFTISSILYLFSIVYGYYCVKDPEKSVGENDKKDLGSWEWLKAFFNMKHIKDTVEVTFKKGPNHRRTKVLLIFALIALIYGPSYGEFTVRYLFTRYRFNWDALRYSFYNTFYIVMHSLGALISISLFSRHLRWDDATLGFISCVSKLAGGIATGLAANSFQMYMAVVIETFNATSFTALRSISSKLVASNELGKMISLFNLMELVTAMVFGPIYSWIYQLTIQRDAGFVYYVSTALIVPPVLIFVWFYVQHRKYSRQSKTEEDAAKKGDEASTNVDTKLVKDELFSSIDIVDEKIYT